MKQFLMKLWLAILAQISNSVISNLSGCSLLQSYLAAVFVHSCSPLLLTNVTDASDAKFCVCDPSRLSRSRRFQRWRVFAFRVVKMLSRRGREDAKTFASAQL